MIASPGDSTLSLSAHHAERLRASGLTDDVIAARGYWTATAADVEALAHMGHSREIVAHGSALMLPLCDVFGHHPFTVARPDVPRLDGRGRPKKYETPRGAKLTLDIPPPCRSALPDSETRLWITEGQKKADAIISHGGNCAVALLGVQSWKKWAMPAWESVSLADRTAYIVFDSDASSNPKVAQALHRLATFLRSRGAHVLIVHLTPGPDGRKVGIDDALAGGETLDVLAAGATEQVKPPPSRGHDRRPELDVTVLFRDVTDAVVPHLQRIGVYRANGGLVRPDREEGAVILKQLGVSEMRGMVDFAVRCVRQGDKGPVPCYPPRDLAEMLVHDPAPAFPMLAAVVSSPVFTEAGRLLDQPGYDHESGLLVALNWTPRPVPDRPTDTDVADARRLWDFEALGDFDFASSADRTAVVALALTLAVRHMIAGPTPLFDVDAPTPGSGKGLLARVATIPTLGPAGVTNAALPREDEETRKALTAYLAQRRQCIQFDNVTARVASAALAKALTESVWDDRQLGHSAAVRYPIRNVWIVTGNNVTYSDEIGRRVVPIRLEPKTDRPELRNGFRHPELEAWVTEQRADLFWALAVFVRAWQAAGRPAPTVRPLGSYEVWTRVVGGILEHVGYPDFLGNRETMAAAADPDTSAWQDFTGLWWTEYRDGLVSVRNLLPIAEKAAVHVHGDTERAQTTSLGSSMAKRRDRFFGEYQIKQGTGRARREWRLLRAVTPRVTYDTSNPESYAGTRTHAQGKSTVSGATGGTGVTSGHQASVALAWERAAEAEARLEREGIQGKLGAEVSG